MVFLLVVIGGYGAVPVLTAMGFHAVGRAFGGGVNASETTLRIAATAATALCMVVCAAAAVLAATQFTDANGCATLYGAPNFLLRLGVPIAAAAVAAAVDGVYGGRTGEASRRLAWVVGIGAGVAAGVMLMPPLLCGLGG